MIVFKSAARSAGYLVPIFIFPLYPLPVFAASAASGSQSWWEVLLLSVVQLALSVAVPVLSVLLARLLQRWGLKIEQEQIQILAQQAADYAEHQAERALKKDNKRTPGAEKMLLALTFAKGMAGQYGLKDKAIRELQKVIEASLTAKSLPPSQDSKEKGAA